MERKTSFILLVWLVWLDGCFLFEVDGLRLGAQAKYKLSQRQKPNLLELPLRSASHFGVALHFVTMRIGTPPKKFLMSVSTCNVLSWVKCRNQCRSIDCSSEKGFYQPNKSRTFRSVPCSSSFCVSDLISSKANGVCPTPDAPCRYDYELADGTGLGGTIGNDSVTIRMRGNQKVILENITIGCMEATIDHPLDGLLGLAPDRQSFLAKALRQTRTTSLSYCLVDYLSPINVYGYLVFGASNQQPKSNMQETDLIMGHWTWSIFYHLNVTGISLDGKMLDIPSHVWLYNPNARSGGVTLDIGNPLTALAAPVYDTLIQALLPSISKFHKVNDELEHCFNSTGFNETLVPKLTVHFGDGAKFEPPVKNYVIGEDIKCLGFLKLDELATSIIGNILQQNYFWEFDHLNYKLKFAPSTCISN